MRNKTTTPFTPTITLREFDADDWLGWAGAEITPDGKQPLIYETDAVTVIVDATGIMVYKGDEFMEIPCTHHLGVKIVSALTESDLDQFTVDTMY